MDAARKLGTRLGECQRRQPDLRKMLFSETMADICRAVGVLTPRDTTQLHNLPLVVRVDVREGDGEYAGAKFNDVKAFYPKDGNGNAAQKAPEPPDKKPAAPAGAPWTKR